MRDMDVRRALLAEINRRHPDDDDTLVVEELGICQGIARVDVAVVNGTVHGFEIKSERDTLARLNGQAGIYNRALEFVTIVAASSHLAGIADIVPAWWGIWIASMDGDEVQLFPHREAQRNPCLDSNALVQFLWREEALNILDQYNLARGLASKNRQIIWDRLSNSFTTEHLGDLVRAQLKQRSSSWRSPASRV